MQSRAGHRTPVRVALLCNFRCLTSDSYHHRTLSPMKRFLHAFTLAVALTNFTAFAADQPTREERQARFQEVVDQLDLSEDQKAQIMPIVMQQAADLKALRDNTALKPRHKIKRAREINSTASAEIRALLTPEQQVKYDALREESKAEMREQFRERMKEREAGAGS